MGIGIPRLGSSLDSHLISAGVAPDSGSAFMCAQPLFEFEVHDFVFVTPVLIRHETYGSFACRKCAWPLAYNICEGVFLVVSMFAGIY